MTAQGPAQSAETSAVLREAHEAIKELCKALIVVQGTLNQPYPDRPELTPWDRWCEKPFHQGAQAEETVRRHLKALLFDGARAGDDV